MSIRLTLRQRLLLIVLVPALLLAGGMTGFLLQRANTAAETALRERALAIVSFLAPAAEYGVISGNRVALEGLLDAVLRQRAVVAAGITDAEGSLLATSGRRLLDPHTLRNLKATAAQIIPLTDGRVAALAPVMLEASHITAEATPAVSPSRLAIGWVLVELDTSGLVTEKRRMLLSTLGLSGSVLALTLLLAIGLSGAVSRPLTRLAKAVHAMSHGQLDTRVPEHARIAELRTLEQGFNIMASAISDAQHTMQQRIDDATAQLAHQATHDLLTGLPNRRAFEQALEEIVTGSRRASDAAVLCFLDLDRFKQVNDTAGHAAGDALLKSLSVTIRERVRTGDLLCRIGGDEFGLILRSCGIDEGRRIAENLRQAVTEYRLEWAGTTFSVGLSAGLVALDERFTSPGDALVAADLACYAAKRKGRNSIEVNTMLPGDSQL